MRKGKVVSLKNFNQIIEFAKKYNDEAKRRGMTFKVNPNLIHRVITGEFDRADGVAVGVSKVVGE